MAKQKSSAPTQKLIAMAITSVLMFGLTWLLNQLGIVPDDTSELTMAVSQLVTLVVGYVVPPADRDQVAVNKTPSSTTP